MLLTFLSSFSFFSI
jgi:hypothetical protein